MFLTPLETIGPKLLRRIWIHCSKIHVLVPRIRKWGNKLIFARHLRIEKKR